VPRQNSPPREEHKSTLVLLIQQVACQMEQNFRLKKLALAPCRDAGGDTDHVIYTYQKWLLYQKHASEPRPQQRQPQQQQQPCTFLPSLSRWTDHLRVALRSEDNFKILESVIVMNLFTSMNRLGLRQALFHQNLSMGTWPIILERLGPFRSVLFYVVREHHPVLLSWFFQVEAQRSEHEHRNV
jgi:hypothetical protein